MIQLSKNKPKKGDLFSGLEVKWNKEFNCDMFRALYWHNGEVAYSKWTENYIECMDFFLKIRHEVDKKNNNKH